MSAPSLVGRWLGRQPFAECLEQQLRAREAVIDGTGPETLFMVEHPPTVTLGRRGRREDVLWTDEQLAAAQVDVCETPRGGEATLHAPGQLVAYPIVKVGFSVRGLITHMGEATVAMFEQLGVDGTEFRLEQPGVWRGESKMASVGLHVRRGVTIQGMSINLDVAPTLFGALVSCGLPDVQMTSVAAVRALSSPMSSSMSSPMASPIAPLPSMPELARRWAEDFAARAGYQLDWVS